MKVIIQFKVESIDNIAGLMEELLQKIYCDDDQLQDFFYIPSDNGDGVIGSFKIERGEV
jgi:hypothetical protein